MAAIIVALSIVTALVGERIGINGGQGWDGATYVGWATDFRREVLEKGTTLYHAQRVLPSLLVHLTFASKPTVAAILWRFYALDTLALMFAAVLWAHLGFAQQWRRAAHWVGFVALFGCFANVRHALYYPALTDSTAFALGMALTWAYLTRKPLVIYACIAATMVTWPGLTPVAICMLVVPRLDGELPPVRFARWIAVMIALAATAGFLLLARHYLAHPVQELGIPKFATWVRRDWLPITVPLLAVTLAAAWFFVVDQPALWNVVAYVRTIRWRYVAVATAGVAVLYLLRAQWLHAVATKGKGPTTEQFLCLQTLEALRGPLWGPVHHVVYFGPIVAIGVVHWRAVCRVVGQWGHGAVLAFAMLVAFAAASESRQWIHLFPLFVAATITATNARWSVRRALMFGGVALVWSKLWLHIGYNTPGDWRVFPTQRYFMHLGPWASDTTWAVHGAAAIVTAVGLWLLLRRKMGSDPI
jgi:hypothetical protein